MTVPLGEKTMLSARALSEIREGQLSAATAELDAIGVPFSYAFSPACLPTAAHAAMSAAWRAFAAGVRAFADRHGGQAAAMAAELRMPAEMMPRLQALPDSRWALFGRPDMVISRGRPMIVDVNVHGQAGLFPLNDMILRTHRTAGVRDLFRQPGMVPRFLMGHYADILRRFLTGDDELIAITIYASEAADPHFGRWHYECEVRELARLGLTARIVIAEDLDITSRGAFHDGRRVGLIRRFFSPYQDRPEELAELARISAAAKKGVFPVVTGMQEELLATKATLAALSDERFTEGLAPSLAAQLAGAVPWTRLLEERHTRWRDTRVDLLPWVTANRRRLVIKPAQGFGGRDVTIGREVSDRDWTALVHMALTDSEPWVVQEVLDPSEEDVVFLDDTTCQLRQRRLPVVYGCYVLDGEFVGAIRRHGIRGSGYAMINGTVGAIPAPVYWADRE